MDPESSPDPTFRAAVEIAMAEDRPAVLVSLADVLENGANPRLSVAITDGLDRAYAADLLDHAARLCREGDL
jgi:hypothetical protein